MFNEGIRLAGNVVKRGTRGGNEGLGFFWRGAQTVNQIFPDGGGPADFVGLPNIWSVMLGGLGRHRLG